MTLDSNEIQATAEDATAVGATLTKLGSFHPAAAGLYAVAAAIYTLAAVVRHGQEAEAPPEAVLPEHAAEAVRAIRCGRCGCPRKAHLKTRCVGMKHRKGRPCGCSLAKMHEAREA